MTSPDALPPSSVMRHDLSEFDRRPSNRPSGTALIDAPIRAVESESRDRGRRISAELAARLVAWRERGGWSRQDVARAAGISTSYYAALERATRAPSVLVADAIGWALALTAAEVAELQAQAVTDAGRSHPERLKREARRPPAHRAQSVAQWRQDLLAAIARDRATVHDPAARNLTDFDVSST
jgi:transcriptional regulator with XRE-family HTH domain